MVELNYVGSLLVVMNGINMEKVETPFYWLAVVIVKVSFLLAPNHFVQDELMKSFLTVTRQLWLFWFLDGSNFISLQILFAS